MVFCWIRLSLSKLQTSESIIADTEYLSAGSSVAYVSTAVASYKKYPIGQQPHCFHLSSRILHQGLKFTGNIIEKLTILSFISHLCDIIQWYVGSLQPNPKHGSESSIYPLHSESLGMLLIPSHCWFRSYSINSLSFNYFWLYAILFDRQECFSTFLPSSYFNLIQIWNQDPFFTHIRWNL